MIKIDVEHRCKTVNDGTHPEISRPRDRGKLALTVKTTEGETGTSLASRIALRNGVSMRALCRDMAIPYADVCHGVPQAVVQVTDLIGCDSAPILFHTPRLIEHDWFQLGRERLKFTALLRGGGQICPLCVAEDEADEPHFGPWQRYTWQVAAFRRCRKHDLVLERPKYPGRHSESLDFTAIVRSWAPSEITRAQNDRHALEDYLLSRIQKGISSEWIDRQAFHVAWLFSEALGILLTKGPKARIPDQDAAALIAAGHVGFEILKSGPQALLSLLGDIRDQAGSDRGSYGKIYGPVLTCLRERRRDPEFDEIRCIVREFILDNFRIAPGTSILGEICNETRMFTVLTASRHFNVPISQLTRKLRMEGLLTNPQHNNDTDRNLLFRRDNMEKIAAELRKLSSMSVTRAVIGADRFVMDRLRELKLLRNYFPVDGGMPMFHQDEVMRFIRNLQAATHHVLRPGRRWKPITKVAANCHCSTAWVIQQVFAGNLELVSSQPDPFLLAEFLVSVSEIKELLDAIPLDMVNMTEAARLLAADVPTVKALITSGHLASRSVDSRLANRPLRLISRADLERFARNHVVVRALSGTRKAQYITTLAFIEEQGVFPLLAERGVKPVFERHAIERISRLPGGEQLARLLGVEDTRFARPLEAEPNIPDNIDAGGAA
ncbi:TniQ family protein [Paracoccus methylarcula]|uniref:TniQ domain-containing protein n=1 Tax=Paracoccus methylarcula TaxID=72022 RepID=A0A422QZA6_9RHOB|nr:TniQ family protein [Paracoccus methylarcula]RNF35325.1 hypothetical protein A7A09_006935 [Paracoccus methylarcula]